MKVVVSVGGSVLVPDMQPTRVQQYAAVIEKLVDSGYQVGAVVGGGRTARDYIDIARELGANEIELDHMGIAVTRLNARLVLAALDEDLAAPTIPEDYEDAGEALHHSDVTVMGGVQPGQTTDAVSAALAEYVDADLLVYATSVAGVYDADPKEVDDAERFDSIRAGRLVEVVASMEMAAGSNAPVDLLAAKLIQRAGMHAVVLDGSDPTRVADAVLADEYDGTEIVPDYR